jgi:hypothetical protein
MMSKTFVKSILRLGYITALFLISCDNNAPGESQNSIPLEGETISQSGQPPELNFNPENPPKITLLLVDKTGSSIIDSVLLQEYQEKVTELISANFTSPGAKFQGYFVHSNTLGVPPFAERNFDTPIPDNFGELPKIRRKRIEAQVRLSQQKLIEEVVQDIKTEMGNQTSRNTDLWGTFELMSIFFSSSQDVASKDVVFISDMMESMRGKGRRNFHSTLPKSKEEAESWAIQDAQWIRNNFNIDDQTLSETNVKIWPPVKPLDPSTIRILRYYWTALFRQFGIGDVDFF